MNEIETISGIRDAPRSLYRGDCVFEWGGSLDFRDGERAECVYRNPILRAIGRLGDQSHRITLLSDSRKQAIK